MDDLLFNSGELRLALLSQEQKLRAAIEAEPEETFRQADEEQWAAALAHHFAVPCPELKTDQVWREPVRDVKVDVSRDPLRAIIDPYSDAARNFPGYRVVIQVPFEGEADVFKLRPSSFTFNPPRGRVNGKALILTIDYPRDQQVDIDARAQEFIRTVSQWLGFARADITAFNSRLPELARQSIALRRQGLDERDAHLAKSKIPVRRLEAGKKTYFPEVLIRRPAPLLPTTRGDDKAPMLEPVLEERVFEHILGVIRMQGRQMEQSPATYAGMGEEDRRQTIVATLNTHYEGRAHAEAFNVQGKTDVLIRYEGRNLFICECKFWTGAESLTGTIDQLFRYSGWRDTKLAIVMFVREKALTPILDKARSVLSIHPRLVEWKKAAEETELRAFVRWPGDDKRLADLNVFFVHTPQGHR